MSRGNLFHRYIWILDTIKSRGRITLKDLNVLWKKAPFSDGNPLPRRTFFHYREEIAEIFKVDIECDKVTFEYYINQESRHNESVTDWMLNSAAMSEMMVDVREISDRVFMEDVPSARQYLSLVVKSMKEHRRLTFTYSPYSRSKANSGVVIEPYFLKIFRQRWYVTGLNVKDGKIKTYALDRMQDVLMNAGSFVMPPSFDAEEFCSKAYGIVFSQAEAKDVVIRADARQSKYLRTLPLHHSQQELVHDSYSVFTYRLQLSPDFVSEILSHGPGLTVVSPPELKAMVVTQLKETLANYE